MVAKRVDFFYHPRFTFSYLFLSLLTIAEQTFHFFVPDVLYISGLVQRSWVYVEIAE